MVEKLDKIPSKIINLWYNQENKKIRVMTIKEGMVEINSIAAMIWIDIDGKKSIREIANRMHEKFKNIELNFIQKDVLNTVDKLIDLEVVTLEWNEF